MYCTPISCAPSRKRSGLTPMRMWPGAANRALGSAAAERDAMDFWTGAGRASATGLGSRAGSSAAFVCTAGAGAGFASAAGAGSAGAGGGAGAAGDVLEEPVRDGFDAFEDFLDGAAWATGVARTSSAESRPQQTEGRCWNMVCERRESSTGGLGKQGAGTEEV